MFNDKVNVAIDEHDDPYYGKNYVMCRKNTSILLVLLRDAPKLLRYLKRENKR